MDNFNISIPKAQQLWNTHPIFSLKNNYNFDIYYNDEYLGISISSFSPFGIGDSFIFLIKNNKILWEKELISGNNYEISDGYNRYITDNVRFKIEKFVKLKSFI